MKKQIIARFERVSQKLDRHSMLANAHRRNPENRHTVEILEETRSAPNVGLVKEYFINLFDDTFIVRFIIGLLLAFSALAVINNNLEVEIDKFQILAAISLSIAVTQLLLIIVRRFKIERGNLLLAKGAVDCFENDVDNLLVRTLLVKEEGTAGEIIDRRAEGHALEIVSAEKAGVLQSPRLDIVREQMRHELCAANKFGLGKSQQSYFDAAKAEWAKLAREGKVMTDYCI